MDGHVENHVKNIQCTRSTISQRKDSKFSLFYSKENTQYYCSTCVHVHVGWVLNLKILHKTLLLMAGLFQTTFTGPKRRTCFVFTSAERNSYFAPTTSKRITLFCCAWQCASTCGFFPTPLTGCFACVLFHREFTPDRCLLLLSLLLSFLLFLRFHSLQLCFINVFHVFHDNVRLPRWKSGTATESDANGGPEIYRPCDEFLPNDEQTARFQKSLAKEHRRTFDEHVFLLSLVILLRDVDVTGRRW